MTPMGTASQHADHLARADRHDECSNSSISLSLTLPKGTVAGDEVVLSTTTSPASGSESVTTPPATRSSTRRTPGRRRPTSLPIR